MLPSPLTRVHTALLGLGVCWGLLASAAVLRAQNADPGGAAPGGVEVIGSPDGRTIVTVRPQGARWADRLGDLADALRPWTTDGAPSC